MGGGCTYYNCGCTAYRELAFSRPVVKQHRYTQWTETSAMVNGKTVGWIQGFGSRLFTIYLKNQDGSDRTLCATAPMVKAKRALARHLQETARPADVPVERPSNYGKSPTKF